ncbi:Phenylacetate-coenzyme A ligase [Tepidimonas alkaliphilus]|uniref:Phenylacetate-coenzyme A ligase n=1 Tax=Tepidimonas alkaliphilus TaxID=2588942 RepID=A0A554WBV6_9BURK|nr:AMP-binding protein [Tepidimonas alkaliphilus]TSE21059.1 Phenylacetate-coenzyme A ligase [Tepidimonas alkaliphilus]
MPAHHDDLETRDPAAREAALLAALPDLIAHAQRAGGFWAAQLAGLDPATVTTRAALARLPVLRKHELMERQHASRAAGGDPFGGLATVGWRGLLHARGAKRVYQSPGPIYEPEGEAPDYWRTARALVAAGFEAGDLIHNAFSYHLTPGAWMMEAGAQALGCTVFPGGVGHTEQQLAAILDLQPVGYCGTPSFLRILVEKAEAAGQRLPIRKALVSGEAFPPSLRDWLRERGIDAYQAYATADAGLIAYETPAREGLVLDEGVLLEIVRPGTGDPVADGEVGEVVVTVFNPAYPLIRFGTGDLSAVLPGACPTGRTNVRIRGWLGRADQTTKVKGMFVHPSQVAEVVRRHPQVRRARLVVSGRMADDRMTLRAETADPSDAALRTALAETLRDVTKLRGEVELLPEDTLPNDGKVIEDARTYD